MELSTLFQKFAEYPVILFFLSAFFGGEELIIPLAILVGHGLWSLQLLFLVCFIATLFADVSWFLLGRHGVQKRKFFQKYQRRFEKASKFFRRIAKSEMGILLTTKFIYGTRIFSIIFLSIEGVALSRFVKLNSLVTFIWLSCIVFLGWMIGRGSALFLNLSQHRFYIGAGILLIIIVFHYLRHYFAHRFLPELEE